MSTYLQGVNDYISQVNPPDPNLAFNANVTGTLQTRYDQGHAQVSNLYGSLLNSPMTRDENIKSRDEFFKLINNDIRQMGGLDYSLKANVQAAGSVFNSIYNNKNIVKDMMWTRNFNDEMERANAFKDCMDPAKCGGQYWDEGVKYMQYKREEFKNSSRSDAMRFEDVAYIPYSNTMDKAMEIAKKANLKIKVDHLSGDYIITTQNGQQLSSPLTQLLSQTLGADPKVRDMYKAKAYVERKDWMYSKINSGEFTDENSAQLGYVKLQNDLVQKRLSDEAEKLHVDLGHLEEKFTVLDYKAKNGLMIKDSEEHKLYQEVAELVGQAREAKQYTELLQTATNNVNNSMALRAIGDVFDNQNAGVFLQNDILKAADILAYQDAEIKYEVNELAKQQRQFAHDVRMEQLEHKHAMDLAELNNAAKKEVAQINNAGKVEGVSIKQLDDYQEAMGKTDPASVRRQIYDKLYKKYPNDITSDYGTFSMDNDEFKSKFGKEALRIQHQIMHDANVKAIVAKQDVPFIENITWTDLTAKEITNDDAMNVISQIKDKYGLSNEKMNWLIANHKDGNKSIHQSVADLIAYDKTH